MAPAFGTPQYGNSNTTFWKSWKLKTPDAAKGETVTSFICLIIPPMKSLGEAGKWCVYHGQHFGYSGVDPRNPDKTKMRPFACIEKTDYRTKMVTVACPACESYKEKEEEKELREAEYKAKGLSDAQIKEHLDPLVQWLKKHNIDRKWHINVMSADGEFGVLQISHTLYKSLMAKMEELRTKRKIEPILDGVWWEFTRMGKFPVQDSVNWVMESFDRDGETFERIKKTPLTEAQGEKAWAVCPDLATETVKFISGQQIAQIVASSGDPEEIDRIWQQGASAPRRERTPVSQAQPQPQAHAPANAAPVKETVRKPTDTVIHPEDEIAALQARLAALQSVQKAATEARAVPAAVTAPAGVMDTEDPDDLSDEEFFRRFGVKQ